MPVEPNEFLDFAKKIELESEINIRNAISRAYYAMYTNAASIYGGACKKEKRIKLRGSHERMAKYIELYCPVSASTPPNANSELAWALTKAKQLRHAADYHLDNSLFKEQAEHAIDSAEDFISKIYSL